MIMERENLKSYLIGISYSVASVMVGYSHTLALLFRSSIEASKKQPRVWLEYALYPRMLCRCYTDVARYIYAGLSEKVRRCNGDGSEFSWRYY